jgi:hypothetical protein
MSASAFAPHQHLAERGGKATERSMVPLGTEENLELMVRLDGRAARFYELFRAGLLSLATGPGYKSNRTLAGPGNSNKQVYLGGTLSILSFYPIVLRFASVFWEEISNAVHISMCATMSKHQVSAGLFYVPLLVQVRRR